MSLLDSFLSGASLDKANVKTAQARKAEGEKADSLFQEAYENFQKSVAKYNKISETLYSWGFALLHQAQTKSGEEAIRIYQDANIKFSFCLTIVPQHLGAAVDGGVALMGQARVLGAQVDDALYSKATEWFDLAETIQAGSASYNLACMNGLREDADACLAALEKAHEHGLLPAIEDIKNDADLSVFHEADWFIKFIQKLEQEAQEQAESEEVQESTDETVQEASSEEESQSASADAEQEPADSDTKKPTQ